MSSSGHSWFSQSAEGDKKPLSVQDTVLVSTFVDARHALSPAGRAIETRLQRLGVAHGAWYGVMQIVALNHVQLAMPPGQEDRARAFYAGVLAIPEVVKPAHLVVRGGCWFERGDLKVHLGIDQDFRAARKAHPAFTVVDLPSWVRRLEAAGHPVVEDEPLAGYQRCYLSDPFGNRIELIERLPM